MQCTYIYLKKQLKAVQLGNFQIDYYTLLKIYCWVLSKSIMISKENVPFVVRNTISQVTRNKM